MIYKSRDVRIFNLLKQPANNFITPLDFKPLLKVLLATHPGLDFLKSTPAFQEKYGILPKDFTHFNQLKL